MTLVAWILLVVLLAWVGLAIFAVQAAYRNGVRDGYSSPWLPAVKQIVKEYGLKRPERTP